MHFGQPVTLVKAPRHACAAAVAVVLAAVMLGLDLLWKA